MVNSVKSFISIFKQALLELSQKQWHIIAINRSIFSWNSFLSLLCQALEIEEKAKSTTLEKSILKVTRTLNSRGKCLIFIIDDAHVIPQELLKRIRMFLEDFPKNHNLILIGHLELMDIIKRRSHEDIFSRITNSAEFKRLSPADTKEFIYHQLDRAQLPHTTFTHEAIELICKLATVISDPSKTSPSAAWSKPSVCRPKPSITPKSTAS